MANKFIVFVVFAAVAQASLAAVDLKDAEEKSRKEWRRAADTICKVVRKQSLSIEDAKEEYHKYQLAGAKPFFEAAHLADNPDLRAIALNDSAANRDALFNTIEEARECENYDAIKAAIENYKKSLPYGRFIEAFHAVTKDTGSVTPAVNEVKEYYGTLFDEVLNLAKFGCGEEKLCIDTCPRDKLHELIDTQARLLYSWL